MESDGTIENVDENDFLGIEMSNEQEFDVNVTTDDDVERRNREGPDCAKERGEPSSDAEGGVRDSESGVKTTDADTETEESVAD